ncbi:MAG: hypothetical protein WA824_01140 [Candidatus Sulfotelmatobacter sp.]
MFQPFRSRALSIITLLTAATIPLRAQKPAAAPDATLYTYYSGSPTSITVTVCGSTSESAGCYGGGTLGPFVSAGAILEGQPSVSGDVVTRAIYVVDSGANPVQLFVYTKTDTVSASGDSVSIVLTSAVGLPFVGGSDVTVSMAANSNFLFIGTDQNANPVKVRKSNFGVNKLREFSGATTSITSDQYGYITVVQGDAFVVYGLNGDAEEDGGGSQFMVGTTQALPVSGLFGGIPRSALQLGHKLKFERPADAE